jgi:hypothetical protein
MQQLHTLHKVGSIPITTTSYLPSNGFGGRSSKPACKGSSPLRGSRISLSSSGLGRYVLSVETPARIRLGIPNLLPVSLMVE